MDDARFSWAFRWGGRDEGAISLANRFCKTIDGLAKLYPHHRDWVWADRIELLESDGDAGHHSLATIRRDMPKAIERNAVIIDGNDEADPEDGFWIGAMTDPYRPACSLSYSGGVGATRPHSRSFDNDITFEAGEILVPAYSDFRDTLLLLAETWEATYGLLCPDDLSAKRKIGLPMTGWMAYLSPRAATMIDRPSGILVDERPDGGLVLTATTEPFDIMNSSHRTAARQIERVLDVFNDPSFDRSIPYK